MSIFSRLFQPKPFFDAVRSNDLRSVRRHLESGQDPDAMLDGERGCALHFGVHAGLEMVALLVQHGANVNARSDDGRTPLHFAAYMGYTSVVSFLIQHGADVNARDHSGRTPLFTVVGERGLAEKMITPLGAPTSDLEREEAVGRAQVAHILQSCGGTL